MRLSTEERRALALIGALLLLAATGRWLERPRVVLEDAPLVDLAQLEADSRAALAAERDRKAATAGRRAAGSPANPAGPPKPAPPPQPTGPIDLGRATAAELETVRGIGPVLAQRLIARRDSLGGFREWADVDAVPGVGTAMLARLKELAVLRR